VGGYEKGSYVLRVREGGMSMAWQRQPPNSMLREKKRGLHPLSPRKFWKGRGFPDFEAGEMNWGITLGKARRLREGEGEAQGWDTLA